MRNEVIRQRQRARQEIDYAITQMREIEGVIIIT